MASAGIAAAATIITASTTGCTTSSATGTESTSQSPNASGERKRSNGFSVEDLETAMKICNAGRASPAQIDMALPYFMNGDSRYVAALCVADAQTAAIVSGVPEDQQQVPLTDDERNTKAMWSAVQINADVTTTFAYLDTPKALAAPGSSPYPNQHQWRKEGIIVSQAVSIDPMHQPTCNPLPDIALGQEVTTREEYDTKLWHYQPATDKKLHLMASRQEITLVEDCNTTNATPDSRTLA